MIAAMLRRSLAPVAVLLLAAACSDPPSDPLQLDGTRLTVFNRTTEDWTDVEIWLNRQFRVTVPRIEAGGPFHVWLDSFTAGYGQRFNYGRMKLNDLRLMGTRSGERFELVKEFEQPGLAGALKAFGGKR